MRLLARFLRGKKKKRNAIAGFSLIESLLSIVMFAVIGVATYNAFTGLLRAVTVARAQLTTADLLTEQVEIVRNLAYSDVGIVSGLPSGVLDHVRTVTRGGFTYTVTTTVHSQDNAFDGTAGGSPNDLSPADYKLVQIDVACTTCIGTKTLSFTTVQAAKYTEGSSTNGTLFIRALDASGNPVPQANVNVTNTAANPDIIINDVTDNNGWLKLFDAPPGTNTYQVSVTKSGYTTDATTSVSGGNPTPSKPHLTVATQAVTTQTFSIDLPGTINVSTVSPTCTASGNVPITIRGTKLLGTPSVYKYNSSHTTNASGLLTLSSMEWDSYYSTVTGSTYELAGTIPASPVALSPEEIQDIRLVLAPNATNAVLVTVLDSSTQLPVSDATVVLSRTSSPTFSATGSTGQGYLSQTDWEDGAGQANFTDREKFFSESGKMDYTGTPGDLKLKKTCSSSGTGSGSRYCTPHSLISSTFDLGTAVDYRNIFWTPTSQPSQAGTNSVRIQVATNNDNTTWNFIGPDGTSGTYYTTTTTTMNAIHDTDRYLRYKVYLQTANTSYTPNVSDVSFTYTTACAPPGQTLFTGMTSGYSYSLSVTKSGYSSHSSSFTVNSGWQLKTVNLSP